MDCTHCNEQLIRYGILKTDLPEEVWDWIMIQVWDHREIQAKGALLEIRRSLTDARRRYTRHMVTTIKAEL